MTVPSAPSISQVKSTIPDQTRIRSTLKGTVLFGISGTLFAVTFIASLMPWPLWLRLLMSAANGGFIALLFIVGHDACHGSLTPLSWLNKTVGRISFLPSWHPFVCWDLGHNRIHHSWTNLRGRDYVWAPISKREFDELSPRRQWLERFYRTLPGVGVYYFWEIWFKHMLFPRPADVKRMASPALLADRLSVIVFIATQITLAVSLAIHSNTSVWLALGLSIVIPQILWNSLMGLVILLHHTHPKVSWYDDPEEWSFYSGQVGGTVHVQFPWPIGLVLHHIMEHTAHHIDPRVPLYHLPQAQGAVERVYGDEVIQSHFNLSNLRDVLENCQLYDYRSRRWLRFDGTSQTQPSPS